MAELTRRLGGALRGSWLLRVSLIFVASRIVSVAIMMVFAHAQGPSTYGVGQPDYITFANFWDARWYAYIASAGYPAELPVDANGHVVQNAWAFLPLYPFLVGGLSALTHLSWATTAVIVSTVAGWAFLLMLYRLMRERVTDAQALWAVAFAACAPAAPVLGVGYAESLFLFLVALALWLLSQRRYALVALVVFALAFTRPGALAFALTVAIVWLLRWRARRTESFPRVEQLALALLGAWAAVLGFAWLVIAAVTTGRFDAYVQTELSWRAGYIGWQELAPGTAWFQSAAWWAGGVWTVALPLSALALLVALLLLPATRRLGPELVAWSGSYAFYLFLVFFPQSSTVRILAPMFPLVGAAGQIKSVSMKLALLAMSVAGQVWWVWATWVVIGSDWTPP